MIKVKRGLKKFELISTAIEDINSRTTDDEYGAAVEDAFRRITEREDISGYKIVTSMPADMVLLRNITFPFTDINKITSALPYEVDEIIPCSIDTVSYDFQTSEIQNEVNSTVILAAIDKKIMKNAIDLFNRNGLYPVFSGLESNSMFRCYEYFNSVNNETVLQIDFGHKKTLLNIVHNNSLIYTRAISSSIGNLTDKISDIFQLLIFF